MELKKCSEGHYYDGSLYAECPTCKNAAAGGMRTVGFDGAGNAGATMPVNAAVGGATMPVNGTMDFHTAPVAGSGGATMPLHSSGADEGKTVAVFAAEMGIDPVVGWLVSLDGPEKGRDYRIHSDNNFIGRGEKMDICIRGDETISRERHAILAYDSRDKKYYFAPGEGRSINRINGEAVLTMRELKAYDKIEIGRTNLLFIPLCGERFEW